MKALLVVLVLCGVAHARGAPVDIDMQQVPLVDVARLLGDVGRVNIVLVDVPPETKVDVKVKRVPWDTVLADLVARSKLASMREGNVILVGDPALVAARRKVKRTFQGPVIDIDLRDADAASAALLITTSTSKPVEFAGGTKLVSQRLRRVPRGQAVDITMLVTGGTLAANPHAPPKPKGCIGVTSATPSLKLLGIARSGAKRYALLAADGTSFVVAKGDCVGTDQAPIKDIGDFFVIAKVGAEEVTLLLHPPSP
jgi:hypothetical protein